jgi:CHAT domain-containing protein
MYRAAKKLNSHVLNINDTAAIFTNLIYNDTYCNLTNSTNIGTRGGISPLTYSSTEGDVISNSIPTVKFEKLNASKEQFIITSLVGRYPILHLITHGSYIPYNTTLNNDIYFPTNPNERQLLLFSSDSSHKSNRNNIMTAYETRYFENLSKIKLIFLSACETGSSEVNDYSNSGYQGFVNNFLERGVKSVIATRWKVSDKYSVDFANKYYENLALLKDFQRAFFETKKYFFNNNTPPYLWTSYVFVQ